MEFQAPGWGPQPKRKDPEKPGSYISSGSASWQVTRPPPSTVHDHLHEKPKVPPQLLRSLERLFDGAGGATEVPDAGLRIAYARTKQLPDGQVEGIRVKVEES
mmetsp:Transcript_75187/g.132815  ORF Transcript_75187/g.132815 Transcript_75187/m.132815 type:complete len:103 (-) Transcript_75187:51-359(-)